MKKIIRLLLCSAIFAPAIALAQMDGTINKITDVNNLATRLAGIGSIITYLLVGLAVIYIIWNIVNYMIRGSDPDAKKTAGLNVFWGLVGLFIIVSLWGLVNILVNTFDTDPNVPIDRFPNANFVTKPNSGSVGGANEVKIWDEPAGIPASSGGR